MMLGHEVNFHQPAGYNNTDCIEIDDDNQVCVLPNPTTKDVLLPKNRQIRSSALKSANYANKEQEVIDNNFDTNTRSANIQGSTPVDRESEESDDFGNIDLNCNDGIEIVYYRISEY